MSAKKLKEIESLLLDLIIFCTEEIKCDQEVIDELHAIREQIINWKDGYPMRVKSIKNVGSPGANGH